MFGFPAILDGNAGIKFTRDADSGFPKPGIREIFYSVRDGNWTDTTVWQTASGRVGLLPTANDDVYVRNVILLPTTTTTYNVNNLFIVPNGVLQFGATITLTVNVFGNLQSLGNIIMFNSVAIFNLYGVNNRIDTYTSNGGTINYVASQTQPILNTPTLIISLQNGVKTINQDLICSRFTLSSNASLELGGYNMTVNGIASIAGRLTKSTYGNILITGSLGIGGTLMDLSEGNPDVELRGGISVGGSMANFKSGTGVWTLSTNSQSIGQSGITSTTAFDCQILIKSGITFTIGMAGAQSITLNNIINGEDGTSRLVNNNSTLIFGTAASVPSMTTGIWDFTTNANTIQYNGNYSATIPSYFTTFSSLTIGGTGTKTLGASTINGVLNIAGATSVLDSAGNTTVVGNCTFSAGGTLNLYTYNWQFLSAFIPFTGTVFTKSGAGSLLFGGLLGAFVNNWTFNLSGNPTVECRGGIDAGNMQPANFNPGTGQWTFSTNSQTILFRISTGVFEFTTSPIISGAITVTSSASGGFIKFPTINGTVAGSTYNNAGKTFLNSTTVPMTTGVFIPNGGASSLLGYVFNGNYTLPYTSYNNLTIQGTGIKTLSGNTTIAANLLNEATTSNDGIDLSTFDISVTGITTNNALMRKSSFGSLLFIGLLNNNSVNSRMDFSGNPNVEFRGGFTCPIDTNFNSGTGVYTFSTANQDIAARNPSPTFDCSILISGAIILTQTGTVGSGNICKGTLNGNNAGSTFRMGANNTLNYQNTTQPMATGILDTSTNLNTFIYGAGNQDVKGNPTAGQFQQYRNLRFSGSGTTKTLLGNINVQNTYTVDAGVTVNLNGFTKTP